MLGLPANLIAGLDERDRRLVIDGFGVERPDDGKLVHDRAVCGSSSDTQAPQRRAARNGRSRARSGNRLWPEVMVVRRCPWRIESGRSLSNQFFIPGL